MYVQTYKFNSAMIFKAPLWCLLLGCLSIVACKKEASFVPDEQLADAPFALSGTYVYDDQETSFSWTVGIDSGIVAASLSGYIDYELAYLRSHIGYMQWTSPGSDPSTIWTPQAGPGISLQFFYPTSINFTERTSWTQEELETILQEGTYSLGDGYGQVSVLVNEGVGFNQNAQDTQAIPISAWSGSTPGFGELVVQSKQPYTWTDPNGNERKGYLADIAFSCPLTDLLNGFGPPAELRDCQGRFLFEYQD